MSAWLDKLYATFIATELYPLLITGLKNTMIITLGALVIGIAIGAVIAVIKYFAEDNGKNYNTRGE